MSITKRKKQQVATKHQGSYIVGGLALFGAFELFHIVLALAFPLVLVGVCVAALVIVRKI